MIEQTLNTGHIGQPPATKGASMLATAPTITKARALFLAAAFLSFIASVALFFSGERTSGVFVGLWVPSILALGVFLAPAGAGR